MPAGDAWSTLCALTDRVAAHLYDELGRRLSENKDNVSLFYRNPPLALYSILAPALEDAVDRAVRELKLPLKRDSEEVGPEGVEIQLADPNDPLLVFAIRARPMSLGAHLQVSITGCLLYWGLRPISGCGHMIAVPVGHLLEQ